MIVKLAVIAFAVGVVTTWIVGVFGVAAAQSHDWRAVPILLAFMIMLASLSACTTLVILYAIRRARDLLAL